MTFTREKIVWILITIFAVTGTILGIVAVSKNIILGAVKATDLISKVGNFETEIKIHIVMVVVGGFIAIITGAAAVLLAGLANLRSLEMTSLVFLLSSKTKWLCGELAIIAFVFGVTAMAMNAELNDASWFEKILTAASIRGQIIS